ncbi:hypothetical protein [Oceanobacillus senegalensis]|uniref:hypothetical protein n=1 Tax=Oceanobacillus senegalensis TaxID=1936063 RepID=UPI001C4F9A6E|nr:hypothetical protein [Oceanobacillus senegalensis]
MTITFILFILLLTHKKSFLKGFEYVTFGKIRGIPIGMTIIGLSLYSILDAILIVLFSIPKQIFLNVVNVIISMVISVPAYGSFSAWYFQKKSKMDD